LFEKYLKLEQKKLKHYFKKQNAQDKVAFGKKVSTLE